jgi:hypothetical protein
MPFALTNNASQSEISDAINYLLANFGPNLAADPDNGQISGPSGVIIAYLYKYIAVKYADSFDGSVNFSNSPTGRSYYGLRNSNDSVESSNFADYIWYQAAGGFGTTKFLFYQTSGGRQINFFVGTAAPDSTYLQESGSSIDLDIVTTTTAYNTAAPSIYYWTPNSTPPARPSTTSTYTWATGAYTAPSGWATTPPTNTTAGSYLWAITIPLVVNSNTVTSTLDWTNVAYPIYAFSSNGTTGATGGNGISALTAYRAQSQTSAAPATPSNTSGPTAPAGWSLIAPAVSVGQVLWYSFGRYNSSAATLDGVPSGQTAWGTPTAASIFQDIRSDNWNGSTPPTYGTPGTYGTQGYYISQSTGNVYFNNGVYRGDISTDGDAYFEGRNAQSTFPIIINGLTYSVDYSSWSAGYTAPVGGAIRVGVYGTSVALGGSYNVGVLGYAQNGFGAKGVGVAGQGGQTGGYFSGTENGVITPIGVWIQSGFFRWGVFNITEPTGSTTTFLRNDGTWNTALITAPTNSGTATVSAGALNILGSTSTGIAGAYVGTTGASNTVTLDVRTTSPSDLRLKEEIQEIDVGLAFVKQLRPVSYKLKADPRHQKGYGFIAQEVENLIPNASSLVYEEPDWKVGDEIGFKTIHYPSYIAVLTKAIQELTAKVEALEAKVM